MPNYKNPGKIEFDAIIKTDTDMPNTSAWVDFPFDLKKTFGVGNLVPIKALFDRCVTYQGSLAKIGGPWAMLLLRKDVRAALGKEIGQTVHVTLELDTQKRTIELSKDIRASLKRAGLSEVFSRLPFSHQREYIQWIEEAKKPETRASRIQKLCEMVNAKQK